MGMRITTSMMMSTYRYNLQGSTKNLSDARNKVLSQRNFDSYAEDPSAATQAWRIRRAMSSNSDYQSNNSDTYSRFNIASTTMGVVSNKLTDEAGRVSGVRGENGAIGAGRQPLGQVLVETANTVIQAMNSAQYGDHFVFAGDDEMNPPFTWDGGTLLYRGVNVGAGAVPKPSGTDPFDPKTADQFGIPEGVEEALKNGSDNEKAWAAYYKDQGDLKKLEILGKEKQHVDLGMGLEEDGTGLVTGTAFDRSLPGINMLGGYGVDKDGDPKNVVLIMKRLGELFRDSDPNSGEWAHPGDEEEAMRLLDKLNDSHSRVVENYSEMDARAQFLQQNQTRLETQGDSLQEERLNLEQVDLADAITQFSWDYYCYSAALKVGTQLLSQSLLDYMN